VEIKILPDWADPHERAVQIINQYVDGEVDWKDNGVEKRILLPSKYNMDIDPVEGPNVTLKRGGSLLNNFPFILLESRPDMEPKSQGRNYQGYLYKIHLIGFTYKQGTTNQQPYETLFPAPVVDQGEASEYYNDPKSILKLKYVDKEQAGIIGMSTDYRFKQVEKLFDYIKTIGRVDINLETLQNKFYEDYEMPLPKQDEYIKKKLITKLFNKL